MTQYFDDFIFLANKLQATSGRLEKEELLKQAVDKPEIIRILQFIFDPFILSGISKKKIQRMQQLSALTDDVERYKEVTGLEPNDLLALLDYISAHPSGRDCDLQIIKTYIDLFVEDLLEETILCEVITKNLKLGVQSATLNKIFGKDTIRTFEIMLGDKYFDNPTKYLPEGTKFILTQKLDGTRCVIIKRSEDDIRLFSRQGQVVEGYPDIEEAARLYLPSGYVYDGELLKKNVDNLSSKDLYRATMKITAADAAKKDIIFNCFDLLPVDDFEKGFCAEPATSRKAHLHSLMEKCESEWIQEVPVLYEGTDQSQITYWLDKITAEDGEGVMINISSSPYECKRSRGLLKVKKMQTCDIEVIELEEGSGLNIGRLGAAVCNFIGPDKKIYTVRVGGGFTLEQRDYFWQNPDELVGKIIEVQYFEISSNESGTYSLRFPVFKHVRDDKTEISMF